MPNKFRFKEKNNKFGEICVHNKIRFKVVHRFFFLLFFFPSKFLLYTNKMIVKKQK